MSWSWTLYRYLAARFLGGFAMVYGILLALVFCIGLVDLITNRTAGRGVDTATVIGMAVLQLPHLGLEMLPFAVLFGGAFSFMRLARSQELAATRAAGISAWDFLLPALAMAVLIGVVTVTIVTPVASGMATEFAKLEARHIKGQASLLAVVNGVWLRQGDEQEQSVIHAATAIDQGERLEDVSVLLYRGDRFQGRIDAASAQLRERHWDLRDAWVSGGDGVPRHHDTWQLPTTLTPTEIQNSSTAPTALSFWQLPGFIRTTEAAGFSTLRHQLYFYSLCAMPALFAAMVLMAASFSLRPAREGGTARAIAFSIAAGFGVYFFERLTETLGRSGAVPVLLAATAPAIASILIGMTLVFSREDG